jgi:hypothetical protein
MVSPWSEAAVVAAFMGRSDEAARVAHFLQEVFEKLFLLAFAQFRELSRGAKPPGAAVRYRQCLIQITFEKRCGVDSRACREQSLRIDAVV